MKALTFYPGRTLAGLAAVLLFVALAQAQTRPTPAQGQDDVVRVNTELVQTDVVVFDKNGHFVEGLTAEQFALKVDKKPQTVSFVDRVTSGKESVERNANQKSASPANTANVSTANARSRIVIFFVDDLHLAPTSLVRTREALIEFIDHKMA